MLQITMNLTTRQCARDILETVPLVMRFIRNQARRHRTAGSSVVQFRTLNFLGHGENRSLSAVAEHLGLSLPAVSRLVTGLVKKGLVERQTISTNRRQVALTLTQEGRAAVEKIRGEIWSQLADSLGAISVAEQKVIQDAMRILHGVFGHRSPSADAPSEAKSRRS